MDPKKKRIFKPSKLDPDGYRRLVERVCSFSPEVFLDVVRDLRGDAKTPDSFLENEIDQMRFSVCASLLADLVEQSWSPEVHGNEIYLIPPSAEPSAGENRDSAKARHRNSLLISSDRQLASESVRAFRQSMERDRAFNGQVVSIKSLIDDGQLLATELQQATTVDIDKNASALNRIIKPKLFLCGPKDRCEYTGLKLQDIWRYFRHTWSLEYNPLPGRTLRFIVRNTARKNSPVIGIAMLASPAANLYVRDDWIGWTVDGISQSILDGTLEARKVARTLVRAVDQSISSIRTDDLLSEEELQLASADAQFKLAMEFDRAETERLQDLKNRGAKDHDKSEVIDIRDFDKERLVEDDWAKLSESSLFRKKRSEQLLSLLKVRQFFHENDFRKVPGAALMEALVDNRGRKFINSALNEIRKLKLASEVADVSVCGAVAPYNHILGGKLVTLAMTSREARNAYASRYEGQVSEIASQMAGRPVSRLAELKILTTTSLYGLGSSQYNRLKLHKQRFPKLNGDIVWEELEPTEGFTITHISKTTSRFMRELGELHYGTRRVNSVFGEGSSPRTRQIREGLNLVGINNDQLLKHSMKRRAYAVELYPGAKQALLGVARGSPNKGNTLSTITDAWIRRWLIGRIDRPQVIEAMASSNAESVVDAMKDRASSAAAEPDELDVVSNSVQHELAL